jgi:hypothetical protein
VLHFRRDGIYLAYALGLLTIAVFNRKFYCKYVCPLGAALSIPAPLRIFDWLRRRKECGQRCRYGCGQWGRRIAGSSGLTYVKERGCADFVVSPLTRYRPGGITTMNHTTSAEESDGFGFVAVCCFTDRAHRTGH